MDFPPKPFCASQGRGRNIFWATATKLHKFVTFLQMYKSYYYHFWKYLAISKLQEMLEPSSPGVQSFLNKGSVWPFRALLGSSFAFVQQQQQLGNIRDNFPCPPHYSEYSQFINAFLIFFPATRQTKTKEASGAWQVCVWSRTYGRGVSQWRIFSYGNFLSYCCIISWH